MSDYGRCLNHKHKYLGVYTMPFYPRIAPYNTTFDVYRSATGMTPWVKIYTGNCRLVAYTAFTPVAAPRGSTVLSLRTHYFTNSTFVCNGIPISATTPPWGGFADRIAIPSLSAAEWYVLFTERCEYMGGSAYYRAHLAPLPSPA